MSGIPTIILPQQLIRIADPDEPIYRIYPLWGLEEALRLRQLVLVAPRLWEDPFEVIGDAIAVDQPRGYRIEQVIINQSLPPAYAQCWSATPESDTLLRAYSRVIKDPHFGRNTCPRDEGVRVRSTPRKLLEALLQGKRPGHESDCFIGSVKYLAQDALLQEVTNAIGAIGPKVFENPANRANLLLLKRETFAHEAEVRLIQVCHGPDSPDPVLRVQIDPNTVFDEVSFEPRLAAFEREERKVAIRNLGYTGPFPESGLYQRVLLQVSLDRPPSAG